MSSKWILSATEIQTFDSCRRKWAYQYLDGIKAPSSKAAAFGSAVHSFLQEYLIGNSINLESAEGRVASPGLAYLPKNLPRENVERQIFFSKHGHIFQGYIDFFEDVGSQKWLIGDHKTCSTLGNALTSGELKKNVQANIYAQWAFTEKAADQVLLKWVYYRTKSTPKAVCVSAELSQNEAEENFSEIAKTADEILRVVKEKSPSSAQPKNISACFKYGRCAFYDRCKHSTDKFEPKQTELVKMPSAAKAIPDSPDLGFHLYIDCTPTKNKAAYAQTIELSDLLEPVLQKIQSEKELSHYRFASYGTHVAMIASYLRQHLENNAYDSSTAILSSVKTPEGCDTVQTLSSAAGLVVRGF